MFVCGGIGVCGGQCVPGRRQCSGTTAQVCSSDGQWMNTTGDECLKTRGATCGNSNECASRSCVQGHCCNSGEQYCSGQCRSSSYCCSDSACNGNQTCNSGTCTNLSCGECRHAENHACARLTGTPCGNNGTCQNGTCMAPECQDGDQSCANSTTLRECQNGRWVSTSCTTGGNRDLCALSKPELRECRLRHKASREHWMLRQQRLHDELLLQSDLQGPQWGYLLQERGLHLAADLRGDRSGRDALSDVTDSSPSRLTVALNVMGGRARLPMKAAPHFASSVPCLLRDTGLSRTQAVRRDAG